MIREIAKVYKTDEYELFQRLEGNRDIAKQRKDAIVRSIDEVGYVLNPIVVNEKMEVIDGQGRLAACKELGLPIYYVIAKGARARECMYLNQFMRNWSQMDFVKSYEEQGIVDFARLHSLIKEYSVPIGIAYFACKKAIPGRGNNAAIKEGTLKISESEYATAKDTLKKLMPLLPFINKADCKHEQLTYATIFAIRSPNVDYERLSFVLRNYYHRITPFDKFEQSLDQITNIYNYRITRGENRVYLKEEYNREKYSGGVA